MIYTIKASLFVCLGFVGPDVYKMEWRNLPNDDVTHEDWRAAIFKDYKLQNVERSYLNPESKPYPSKNLDKSEHDYEIRNTTP
jgi:hypothetical protein